MSNETVPQSTANDSNTQTRVETLTREELFELVWQKPMLRIAEQIGVSSSYMARICTELRVPRPQRGYWMKLEHGQSPIRPPLPPSQPGDATVWHRGGTWDFTEPLISIPELLGPTQVRKTKPIQKNIAHVLIEGAKVHFQKNRKSDDGLLRPTKKLLVDIVVSEQLLDNALTSANFLFQSLEARGHRVLLALHNTRARRAPVDEREVPVKDQHHQPVWSPYRPTLTYVDGVPIGLTLFEMTELVEVKYVNGNYIPLSSLSPEQLRRYKGYQYWNTTRNLPSGRLCLQAYSPHWQVSWLKQWRETKPGQFSSMVEKIVLELEDASPTITRQIVEAERIAAEQKRIWDQEREQYRIEAARARQAKARHDSRNDLLSAISAWDEAKRIHAYFDSVEMEANRLNDGERTILMRRIGEARDLIGKIDALAILKSWKSPTERIS
ncbi:hypothetical protein AAKU67_002811 [Oxalobacteraceae bacterium GrIS 2.11]